MSSLLQDKIDTFYKKRGDIFKKPMEKIINTMLKKCQYINEESLERHNWGKNPIKLKNIPKDISSHSFEEDLLNALNLECNEKSTVELLWGDIQLGKRVHACIIMWISVYILERPVLYIFRNLSIDQKQLQDDIVGTEKYNFNIQFIKSLFEEFNKELQYYFFEENNTDYWKSFKLPELQDINSNDIINKLSNKDAINSTDIFCCLMNHKQLEKINSKFSEYIKYNDELVNITTLVDESDLMCPTSSNDRSNDKDYKDSTICERLLAKIYKKVKYALHITGTAHSLLYNVTTRLSDTTDIQIKISKVHKMKRSKDYFGLFNNSIYFNTTVNAWWDYQEKENHAKKLSYDILHDYDKNIKKIIRTILERPTIKYNSLLISEEKIRANQFCLVNKIIKDFPDIFTIIYHGNCLRLYLPKTYERELKFWSKWDSEQSSTSQRLWQFGGVYTEAIYEDNKNILPNNYCYFDIDTKKLNIKLVYKLLRILFEKSDIPIINKTIVTITGKYGERGYSFTSDDYENYSLHLTDQYFVSHASLNCTDISQRLRLQGKYNDLDLINGKIKLTLWTTHELHDIIMNFYVKFIKEIELFIMSCETWEENKELLESIIDNGDFKFCKYMKYIDVSKKRKNLQLMKHYDSKNNGYKMFIIDDMEDIEIKRVCKENKLPDYICVNEIKELNKEDFIDLYGENNSIVFIELTNTITFEYINDEINLLNIQKNININNIKKSWIDDRIKNRIGNTWYDIIGGSKWKKFTQCDLNRLFRSGLNSTKRRINLCYDNDKLYLSITYAKNTNKLPKNTNNYIKKTPYCINNNNVKYSVLKDEYKQKNTIEYNDEEDNSIIECDTLPNKYYWKTPDGWLYLYDKDKPKIFSLNIIQPLEIVNSIEPLEILNIIQPLEIVNSIEQLEIVNSIEPLEIVNIIEPNVLNTSVNNILLFTNACFKKTDKQNLRFGIKEIHAIYEKWCIINRKEMFVKKILSLKKELELLNYTEEKGKGIDINNKSGKRGYNIILSL